MTGDDDPWEGIPTSPEDRHWPVFALIAIAAFVALVVVLAWTATP